jgi:hypothetical protein
VKFSRQEFQDRLDSEQSPEKELYRLFLPGNHDDVIVVGTECVQQIEEGGGRLVGPSCPFCCWSRRSTARDDCGSARLSRGRADSNPQALAVSAPAAFAIVVSDLRAEPASLCPLAP